VALGIVEFLAPEYVKDALSKLDITLTSLRDAIRGAGNKTLTDLDTRLGDIYSRLDVAISTRASESTLSAIKTQTDKLTFDTNNFLRVNVSTTVNPPNLDITLSSLRDAIRGTGNKTLTDLDTRLSDIYGRLDVSLSTRASETTLSSLSGKFPSAAALGDSIANPTTTIVGGANLLWTGSAWARLGGSSADFVGSTLYGIGTIPQWLPSRQAYLIDNINVTTTEGSTSISAPGAKILIIKNKGDVDAMIGLNSSVPTTNPLIVRARTVRVIPHKGVTAVYYKTASGSTTLEITYFN